MPGEMDDIFGWALQHNAPFAVRYPRGCDSELVDKSLCRIQPWKWETLNEGGNIALVATGRMVQTAIMARESFWMREFPSGLKTDVLSNQWILISSGN
jgi:1-deoxy-D-xylulose-5-phosphate synthase